jgi:phenylpyruvate tautomerase PptA (4-oxalocrotonate tautomerase family)
MPLIDVTYTEGSLTPKAEQELLKNLWSTAIRWEGIEVNDASASVAWAYLDRRPKELMSVGGRAPTQNIYRIGIKVMLGFMEQSRIDGMVREVTDAILAADGTKGDGSGTRVFCIVEEVPNGTWSLDGKIWTTVYTAQQLRLSETRIAAMTKGLAQRPRLDVPADA